jgi:uncharacterized protein YeaC (DUF1315 family)
MPLKNLEAAMTITLNPQNVIDKKQKFQSDWSISWEMIKINILNGLGGLWIISD